MEIMIFPFLISAALGFIFQWGQKSEPNLLSDIWDAVIDQGWSTLAILLANDVDNPNI